MDTAMQNGLYVVDFHAHLQDCLTQDALCKEHRDSLLFKKAGPLFDRIAHLSEPYYSSFLRSFAIDHHNRLSPVYRLIGNVILLETLRLFKKYGVEQLLETMDRNHIDHAVIHSLEPLTSTRNILDLIAPHRDRLSVFASVHRNEEDPVGYFKSLVESGQISGLKIHPIVGGFACGELYHKVKDVVEYVSDRSLPILIHTGHIPVEKLKGLAGCCEIDAIEPLLRNFPGAKIVLAHIGWESWRRALALARKYPNVYVETSWQNARIIRRAVDTIGAERVLFGSDFPLFNQDFAMQQVRDALTPKEFVLVASVNAQRLLGLRRGSSEVKAG